MTDYIRRKNALYAIQRQRGATRSPAQNRLLDLLRADIVRAPAADVAEVVRCKYCVYLGAPLSGGCYDCKKYMLPYCRPDDFCSYGEQKGGKGNVPD